MKSLISIGLFMFALSFCNISERLSGIMDSKSNSTIPTRQIRPTRPEKKTPMMQMSKKPF